MKKSKRIVLVLTIIFLFFGCQSKDSGTVPRELKGVWGTSAPKYKNCFLELTEDKVIFTNEEELDKMSFNSIVGIELKKGQRVLYTITYEDDNDQEYELSFFYNPSKGGTIRLLNQQKIIWKKTAF
jgi:hypothetical protein